MKIIRTSQSLKRAFTLVELLVVVAVLGVLSCLLIPALARAKPKSITAQCFSNKKQLQYASAMYASDNGDVLPPNAPAAAGTNGWAGGAEDWNTAAANTNASFLKNAVLWPY